MLVSAVHVVDDNDGAGDGDEGNAMMVMATLRTSRPALATAVVARATRIKR